MCVFELPFSVLISPLIREHAGSSAVPQPWCVLYVLTIMRHEVTTKACYSNFGKNSINQSIIGRVYHYNIRIGDIPNDCLHTYNIQFTHHKYYIRVKSLGTNVQHFRNELFSEKWRCDVTLCDLSVAVGLASTLGPTV